MIRFKADTDRAIAALRSLSLAVNPTPALLQAAYGDVLQAIANADARCVRVLLADDVVIWRAPRGAKQ